MLTYQDFLEVGDDETKRMAFIRKAIRQHKESTLYQVATQAELYKKQQNPTIRAFQKMQAKIGRAVQQECRD